jgi:hypothetical protein
MASAAGIYVALWRPDELGYTVAKDIVPALIRALKDLRDRPHHYRSFSSPNGWGTYDHFVPFVEAVLSACEANPDATIQVSR